MTRGVIAQNGDTRISQNGYHYTRTPQGWALTHKLVAEEHLGRKLRHSERVRFKNRDRMDLRWENLSIIEKKQTVSNEKKRAQLRAKIEDLQAQLEELEEHE
jgi:hypothetical protein